MAENSETPVDGNDARSQPLIPAMRISRECVRFHPRTIIARMAAANGVPNEVLMASLGMTEERKLK